MGAIVVEAPHQLVATGTVEGVKRKHGATWFWIEVDGSGFWFRQPEGVTVAAGDVAAVTFDPAFTVQGIAPASAPPAPADLTLDEDLTVAARWSDKKSTQFVFARPDGTTWSSVWGGGQFGPYEYMLGTTVHVIGQRTDGAWTGVEMVNGTLEIETLVGKEVRHQPVDDLAAGTLDLAAAPGRTVVALWATWCAHCIEEVPALNALHAARPNLNLYGVSVDDSRSEAVLRRAVRQEGFSYPVLWDRDGQLSARLGVAAYPTLLVLDGGKVSAAAYGVEDLVTWLDGNPAP